MRSATYTRHCSQRLSAVYRSRQKRPAYHQCCRASTGMQEQPLFRFGLITDVQYADIKDGHSFGGVPRYYRASLNGLSRAVTAWQQQQVDFAVQCGDIIDGFNPKDQSETAMQSVLEEFAKLQKPVHHMIGNHCLYNLPRQRLNELLRIESKASYYAFSPHKAWQFIIIDGYDLSMLGWPEGHPLHAQAKAVLDEKNVNENKNNPENHEGPARRFVMFGGGLGSDQLTWLRQQLQDAKDAGQRVLIFSHLPLHPDTCVGTCLLWNYEEVLQAIWQAGNVVATIAGHAHKDGYAVDEHGVHHRVLNAVLETKPGRDCYGWVDVHSTCLDLVGVDNLESQKMPFDVQQHALEGLTSQDADPKQEEEAALERQPV